MFGLSWITVLGCTHSHHSLPRTHWMAMVILFSETKCGHCSYQYMHFSLMSVSCLFHKRPLSFILNAVFPIFPPNWKMLSTVHWVLPVKGGNILGFHIPWALTQIPWRPWKHSTMKFAAQIPIQNVKLTKMTLINLYLENFIGNFLMSIFQNSNSLKFQISFQ